MDVYTQLQEKLEDITQRFSHEARCAAASGWGQEQHRGWGARKRCSTLGEARGSAGGVCNARGHAMRSSPQGVVAIHQERARLLPKGHWDLKCARSWAQVFPSVCATRSRLRRGGLPPHPTRISVLSRDDSEALSSVPAVTGPSAGGGALPRDNRVSRGEGAAQRARYRRPEPPGPPPPPPPLPLRSAAGSNASRRVPTLLPALAATAYPMSKLSRIRAARIATALTPIARTKLHPQQPSMLRQNHRAAIVLNALLPARMSTPRTRAWCRG